MPNSSYHIENDQKGFWQTLRALPQSSRLSVGLFVCALLSWVSSSLLGNLLTLGKHGVRDINDMLVNAIAIALLMGINFVGNKLRRVIMVGVVATAPLLLWRVLDTIFHMPSDAWHRYTSLVWWFVGIEFGVIPLLNAVLFVGYKKLAGLN